MPTSSRQRSPRRPPAAAALLTVAVLVVALVALPSPARGQGLQLTDEQVEAVVDALKGRPLGREQHDLLVELAREAERAEDVLGGDLLYAGWALVAADRPDLGYPLVREGLGRRPLLATDTVRSMVFAADRGQDGLVRGIAAFAADVNPRAAKRFLRSVGEPQTLDRAARRARRSLDGLATGRWEIPFADDPAAKRVAWWVAPEGAVGGASKGPGGSGAVDVLVLLPDGGGLDGLPVDCQSHRTLAAAAAWAARGWFVVLPGLRGCDASDGLYLGAAHAAGDVRALLRRATGELHPRSTWILGAGDAGLLALQLALRGVTADGVVAASPVDPRAWEHLPPEHLAEREIALRAAELPVAVTVVDPHPRLARALREAGREPVALDAAGAWEDALGALLDELRAAAAQRAASTEEASPGRITPDTTAPEPGVEPEPEVEPEPAAPALDMTTATPAE